MFILVEVYEVAQLVGAEGGVANGDLLDTAAVVSEDAVVLDLDVHGRDHIGNHDFEEKDRQNLLKI
jgi:hypothetical protein